MADVAINSDSADIPAVNFAQQGSDPTAPGASRWLLFFKSTGAWAITNAASAFRLAKHVMTAAGDLTVGGASGVETRLPMGAALQHLRVNAGATALEFADPPSSPTLARAVILPGLGVAVVQGTWGYQLSASHKLGFYFQNSTHNDADEYTLPCILPPGTYSIFAYGVTFNAAGISEIRLGATLVLTWDQYTSGLTYNVSTSATGQVLGGSGCTTLSVKVNGKNGSSSSYYSSLSELLIVQTA